MSFPILESFGSNWTVPNQEKLFDDDDDTCLSLGSNDAAFTPDSFTLIIPWDPEQKTGITLAAANYFCKKQFYVNITHSHNVQPIVLQANSFGSINVDDWIDQYDTCLLLGKTDSFNLLHTRFGCYCDTNCSILLQVHLGLQDQSGSSKLCTVNIYD